MSGVDRRSWALAAAAAALAGWAPVRADDPAPAQRGERVRWPAVRLLDGRPLPEPAALGHAAVVVFFSTTCPFCRRHNPRVQRLADALQGAPLQVLGAAWETRAGPLREHLATQGLRFDVTLDTAALHAAMSRRRVMPLTCVIDRQGRLQELIPGEMTEDDVMGLARWARA